MYKRLFSCFFILLGTTTYAQDGISYLRKMYNQNHNNWYHNMTFVQTTEVYRNDSLIRTSTWYEAVNLPYDLRIDLDVPQKGNFVLYKKDSTYRFVNNGLRNKSAGTNPFIFFLGGMYYMSFDSVLSELSKRKFDVNKSYTTELDGNKVCVIGRSSEKDSGNCIWIDTKNLWIVRQMEIDRGQALDAIMKNHKKLSKGSTETAVDIYINGKLVQVEKYDQISADVPLDPNLFDPVNFSSAAHWYKKQ
jgi:hypothetical protein